MNRRHLSLSIEFGNTYQAPQTTIMAALTRPTEATYQVHENVTVDTFGKFERKKVGELVPSSSRNSLSSMDGLKSFFSPCSCYSNLLVYVLNYYFFPRTQHLNYMSYLVFLDCILICSLCLLFAMSLKITKIIHFGEFETREE